MSTELVRAVYVKPDGVYLNSKSNNDDRPFREWKCDSLTDVYQKEGQSGLDREMVRMFSEYARIQGHHPSVERYRPCLNNWGLSSKEFVQPLRAELDKLAPEDKQTVGLPVKQQTPAAKAYNEFRRNLENEFYEGLAKLIALSGVNPTAIETEQAGQMNTVLIRAVYIKPDGVYISSKNNSDNHPFRARKNDNLTEVYKNEGQRGLDREIVRILCEGAQIKGNHFSMERYRPCLLARGHFSVEYAKKLNAEYAKLTPEDIATIRSPIEKQTNNAKAYNAFKFEAENQYYTELAGCAPLSTAKKPPAKDNGAR